MPVQGVVGRVGLGLGATIVLVTTLFAAASIWLLLTEPVTVATALDSGDISRLADAFLGVFASAVRTLVGYL